MNNRNKDDVIARLLQASGQREQAPEEMRAAVEQAVYQQWKAQARAGNSTRVRLMAIAASVLMAVLIGVIMVSTQPPAESIVSLDQLDGPEAGLTLDGSPLQQRTDFSAGQILGTNDGTRAGLTFVTGVNLRLDHDTRVRILAENHVELMEGRIYIDTGVSGSSDSSLDVRTSIADVRDIGTQYAVMLIEETLDISVREGEVRVDRGREEFQAKARNRIRLEATGQPKTDRIATTSSDWNWTRSVAPSLDGQKRSLSDYLEWTSRQTGWTLVYDTSESRQIARQTTLSGTVSQLPAVDALDAILSTTTLTFRLEDETIHISVR